MRIKVEPKDLFMYAVYFHFNMEQLEVEDAKIQDYLNQHNLVPKSETYERWDNQDFQVMYFGGCYISSHMSAIAGMQREAVERDYLAREIEGVIQVSADAQLRSAADSTTPLRLKELVSALVDEFHHESSFGKDSDGLLKVVITPEEIKERFLQLAGPVQLDGEPPYSAS